MLVESVKVFYYVLHKTGVHLVVDARWELRQRLNNETSVME